MNPTDSSSTSAVVFGILVRLAIGACLAVWTVAAVRWRRRQPVLPYQPRRGVPWRLTDVALLLIVYFLAPMLLVQMSPHRPDIRTTEPSPITEQPTTTKMEHPLGRVLLESHNGPAILLCALLAVVIAPITEEILFRLLLQGWLESLERRLRRRIWRLRPIVAGVVPIGVASLLFAAMHIRGPEPSVDVSTLVSRLGAMAIAGLAVIALAVCWLKFAARATWADLGIVPAKFSSDVRLGLLAFLAVTVPVYAVMFAAKQFLPANVVADPIPLLFLAVALGTLYYRTHRIVPAVVLHAAFNATSVVLLLLSSM